MLGQSAPAAGKRQLAPLLSFLLHCFSKGRVEGIPEQMQSDGGVGRETIFTLPLSEGHIFLRAYIPLPLGKSSNPSMCLGLRAQAALAFSAPLKRAYNMISPQLHILLPQVTALIKLSLALIDFLPPPPSN